MSMKLQLTAATMTLGSLLVGCSPDIVDKSFATMEDARAAGAVYEGGWMPTFLPNDATDLRLRYDVDTNEIWLAFRLGQKRPIASQCQAAGQLKGALPRKAGGAWWPKALTAGTSEKELGEFDFLRCSDDGYIARSRANDESFYWLYSIPAPSSS